VRLATLVALTACLPAAAQVIVNPSRLRMGTAIFDAQPGEAILHCDVTPLRPGLDYGFRFQAGYRVSAQAGQFTGTGHGWTVLMRITPRAGEQKPVYLLSRQRLPEVPKTNATLQFFGGYLLGEGAYDVSWAMVDDRSRVCRKTWHVDVHRSRSERLVKVAMPRDTVWDVSLRGTRVLPREVDDAAPLRLTILLNAAPMFPRRMRLRPGDVANLISAVSSLLERVPTRQVRLVVFNLEQQKELYRSADFVLEKMPEVAQTMYGLELNTVDFQVLQNRRGHVELLADIVNQELAQEHPSDVVLFIGPMSRYLDRVPSNALEKTRPAAPRFLNFQMTPNVPMSSTLPDVVRSAVSKLGGKTEVIRSPGEFARAIARLEKLPLQ
jgi:hypothetical protein